MRNLRQLVDLQAAIPPGPQAPRPAACSLHRQPLELQRRRGSHRRNKKDQCRAAYGPHRRPGRTYATLFVLKCHIYRLIFIRTESCETAYSAKATDDSAAAHAHVLLVKISSKFGTAQLVAPKACGALATNAGLRGEGRVALMRPHAAAVARDNIPPGLTTRAATFTGLPQQECQAHRSTDIPFIPKPVKDLFHVSLHETERVGSRSR
jgi:hypothetical protein